MIWQVLLGDISIRVSLYYHFQYIQAATERFPDDRKGDCCNSWKDEMFYNKLWNSGITAISSISFSSYTSIDANAVFFFHLKQRLQQALSVNINSFEVVLTSQLPQTMASMLTKKLNVTITFGTHMHVT